MLCPTTNGAEAGGEPAGPEGAAEEGGRCAAAAACSSLDGVGRALSQDMVPWESVT